MFVIPFENARSCCTSKRAQAMNRDKGHDWLGGAGGTGCLLDWRHRQQGNTKICWQFKHLFGPLPVQTAWNFGAITGDLRKVCPLGLSGPRLQFAHELRVVCHRFCALPGIASSFPPFIFRIFCTARRKRTFPEDCEPAGGLRAGCVLPRARQTLPEKTGHCLQKATWPSLGCQAGFRRQRGRSVLSAEIAVPAVQVSVGGTCHGVGTLGRDFLTTDRHYWGRK